MKVRIQNDGYEGWNTKITDSETGEPLTHLRVDEVHILMKEMPHAILHCQRPVLDIIADAHITYTCTACGYEGEPEPTSFQRAQIAVKEAARKYKEEQEHKA
jgi:hypothetical protein